MQSDFTARKFQGPYTCDDMEFKAKAVFDMNSRSNVHFDLGVGWGGTNQWRLSTHLDQWGQLNGIQGFSILITQNR